jgi:ABC-type lipoprotein export system ATPase subunit
LLSLLGLMQRPAGGTLVISGRDVSNISQSEAARLRRDLVGFVFQSYSLIGSLTVGENVALPLRYGSPISTQSMRERVNSAMHSVGIDAFAKSRPARLSGGEQQRVAIARALVTRPHVLLADEPTGALDTETGREIIELLKQTARSAGSCLVVVTHDLDVAAAMDRRLILLAGRLGPSQAETGNHT